MYPFLQPAVWTCRVYPFPPPVVLTYTVYPFSQPAVWTCAGCIPSTNIIMDVQGVSLSTSNRMDLQGVTIPQPRDAQCAGCMPVVWTCVLFYRQQQYGQTVAFARMLDCPASSQSITGMLRYWTEIQDSLDFLDFFST